MHTAIAGEQLVKALDSLWCKVTANSCCIEKLVNGRVQTAAEHSLPRQALHGPSWFKAAQHDTDSASRQTTSADWQTSIFEDGFQDGIGQPEGDFLPKPLLRRLKQLAIQGTPSLVANFGPCSCPVWLQRDTDCLSPFRVELSHGLHMFCRAVHRVG